MSMFVKNKQILVSSNFDINNQKLINVATPVSGTDAANKAYVDANTSSATNLTVISGVTGNTNLGTLTSGLTLGMVYIFNTGSTTASVNLGTTATGNEINPYGILSIVVGDTLSVTVNMRLSETLSKSIYISSSNWTNVNLTVGWAAITYTNQSGGGGGSSSLAGLTDVSITSPTDTQVLTYSGGTWINSTGGTSGPVDDISNDVAQDQLIWYNNNTLSGTTNLFPSLSAAVANSGGGGTGVTSLSTALTTETSIRTSADISLSTAVTNAGGGGGTGTTSLSSALSTEVSQRSSADISLSTAVTNAGGGGGTGTTSLSSALSTETSIRTSADISLSTAIGGGSGNVTKVGTPVNYQVGVWTGDGTIKGTTGLTWNDSSLGIRTSTFDSTYPETVKISTQSGNTVTVLRGTGTINNYLQIDVRNTSTGISGSSDLIATTNIGDENFGYVDVGINGSGYTAGVVGNALDAYFYGLTSGNTLIGNAAPGYDIIFFTNGVNAYGNERMRISSGGTVSVQGNITSPTITSLSTAIASETLSKLTDVSLTSLVDSQALTYSQSSGKWTNASNPVTPDYLIIAYAIVL